MLLKLGDALKPHLTEIRHWDYQIWYLRHLYRELSWLFDWWCLDLPQVFSVSLLEPEPSLESGLQLLELVRGHLIDQ